MDVRPRIRVVAILAVLVSACDGRSVAPTAPALTGASLDARSTEGDDDDVARIRAYTIEDLGVPEGMISSVAINVNNHGDVIGDFRGPQPAPGSFRINHSFIYTDTFHDLGLLPGTFFSNASGAEKTIRPSCARLALRSPYATIDFTTSPTRTSAWP